MSSHHGWGSTDWIISVCLIVLVPTMVAVVLVGRNKTEDLREVVAINAWALYDSSYQSCLRGNAIRAKQREVIEAIGIDVEPIELVDCLKVVHRPVMSRPNR